MDEIENEAGKEVKVRPLNENSGKVQLNKKRCPVECFIEKKDGKRNLSVKNVQEDKETLFQQLTGTPNDSLANNIINSAVEALPNFLDNATRHNIIIQNLADSTPKSAEEARLHTQAAVLYERGMRYFSLAENSIQNMRGADMFEMNGIIESHNTQTQFGIKLLRLHNETIEAISRLRRGNDQRITVQHQYVQVNDGGKAVIGQVGGGGKEKVGEVSP